MKKAREPQEKATRGAERRIAAKKSEAKTKRPPPAPAGPDFASFFEHVSGVLFCIAIEPRGRFRFLAVNETFLSATGLRLAQVAGKLVDEVIPKPAIPNALRRYREAIRTRQTVRFEETSMYPTGEKHGEVAVTPFFDARGRATHLFGIVFDTTERKKAETAAREAEERFRVALDHSPITIWHQDTQLRYTWIWNPEPEFSDSKIIGKTDRDLLPPEDAAAAMRLKERVLRTGKPRREEVRLNRPNGPVYFDVAVEPLRDEDGKVKGIACVAVDTTARKIAELALRESEARYARAVTGTNDGLWEWNIITDETYLSPRWKELLGFAPDELPDDREKAFLSRLHPDDVARVASTRKRHFERRTPYEVEARLRMKDGAYRWFLIRGRAQHDETGRPVVISGTISDITPRKEAEERYQRERDFIETLVNLTSAIIVLLDRDGRMVYVNDATLRLLGYLRSDLIGRTPWEAGLMDAAETARSKVRLARLVAGDPNPPREGVLRGKDGRRHFVELTSTSTRTTENEPDRIIVTGTDLTEHHHLQREILRISEQEQARIGHNLHDGIGQTMTGIAALMESLEGELDGAPRETAARIRELVRDAILEVRQMSHGLSPTAVRNRGLPGALQLLAETIRLNHRTACELAADPAIRLDNTERETHVYRIAQEAANNALRHGKPRKIKITLRREGEDECVMEISDDGTGISRQTADRPGGIGLRVMDYRANCLKGTLEVKSARGRGTTVTCRFPIQDPAARDESAASAAHESHAEAEIARDI